MSDHSSFDRETFAILLEKAKGIRSINQYGLDIDVSSAHISRLLRKLIDSPPSPETLSKFANGAFNGVTYSDFMLAAGHINDNTEEDYRDNKKLQRKEMEKKFFQVIMADLYTREFEWNFNKTSCEYTTDLMIEIKNWEYSKWYIDIKIFVNSKTITNAYGQMSLIEFGPDVKASLVVGSKLEFDLFINKPPKSLRANLYVMLIDVNELKIIKEEKLCQY